MKKLLIMIIVVGITVGNLFAEDPNNLEGDYVWYSFPSGSSTTIGEHGNKFNILHFDAQDSHSSLTHGYIFTSLSNDLMRLVTIHTKKGMFFNGFLEFWSIAKGDKEVVKTFLGNNLPTNYDSTRDFIQVSVYSAITTETTENVAYWIPIKDKEN